MKTSTWPDAWAPKPNISFSSLATYRECPRKYWFTAAPAEIRRQFPYSYKAECNLLSDFMVVGQVVDESIKRGLKIYRGTREWPKDMRAIGNQTLGELLAFSRAFTELTARQEKIPFTSWSALERNYYHEDYSEDELSQKRSEIATCLMRYEEPAFRDFLELHWEYDWDIPEPVEVRPVPWFIADGMPIYASYDFVMRGAKVSYVIDWKTGKHSEESEVKARKQLHIYAAFVHHHYKVPFEQIQIGAVWLKESGYPVFEAVNEDVIASILNEWREQHEHLKVLVAEATVADKLGASFFPRTEDKWKCRYCQFRSCKGYQDYKAEAALKYTATEEPEPE